MNLNFDIKHFYLSNLIESLLIKQFNVDNDVALKVTVVYDKDNFLDLKLYDNIHNS